MQFLYPSDYESHRDRNPDRVQGTCEWFLQHEKYQHWRQEQKSSLLWVSADPGCGKSVLAKFLVDELNGRESQLILPGTVCFFFCKDDNDEQKNAIFALRALLHQLFKAKNSLVRHAMTEFRIKGQKFTEEFGTLWKIFITAATDPGCGNVICIIDGLDECEESTRVQLIKRWVDFYSKPNANKPFLKFVVTSRPYRSIEGEFDDLQTIRLRAEDETDATSKDIELVVKARVQKTGKKRHLSDEVQNALVERLISNADRTFLWVSLILADLEKSARVSKGALDNLVSTIPGTLDAVYEKILGRSLNRQDTIKLLHIVVAAVRPLSLKEINVAFAIESNDRSNEDLNLEPYIRDTVKDLCGLFVKFIDSKIYLVHQTAKEFLSKPNNANPTSGLWKYSLDPAESNLILAERCVWYLLFSVFENDPLVIDSENWLAERKVDRYTRRHDFLDYAAKHWAAHFQNAKTGEEPALLKSILEVCDTRSKRFMTWFQVYWITVNTYSRCPRDFTDLMVGSYFGHEEVVRLLLEKDADLNSKDAEFSRTPLSWAARNGHEAVARLLLEKDADLDSKDSFGLTPLSWATRFGHEAVARLLLEKGADLDSKDAYDQTPLSRAAESGHETVVRLLLEKGADLDSSDSDGRTPLSRAAESGHEAVARLLLEEGADLDSSDSDGRTPLSRAAESGHVAVARLLLEKGADPDSKDADDQTPLSRAVRNGHETVVRLLLEKCTGLSSKDADFGQTWLLWAAQNGHEVVVRLLLEKGVDPDSKDAAYGQTPLSLAAQNGHKTVARLLLEKGADLDSKDATYGQTPLSWAAENGHEAVARLLLEKGADLDFKDASDRTPLSSAARKGHEAMTRLLLEKGADPNSSDSYGRTPLSWAARKGHEAVAWLLLQKDADLNSKDASGRTPLSWAAEKGHKAVARLLLENGVDLDSMDAEYGQTLLLWAAQDGQMAIAMLLLEKGADPNPSDSYGRTPLSWAAERGHGMMVRLLLEKGAALDSKDAEYGRTPLSWAAERGHVAVVRLLLEKGADLDSKDAYGRTPLSRAMQNRKGKMVRLLLEKGADLDSKNADDQTLLR